MVTSKRPLPAHARRAPSRVVERVQVGVRLEKRMVKVLKGLAEALDLTLADVLEGIVLHAFDGQSPFGPATLERIRQLRVVYGLELGTEDAHHLREAGGERGKP
jgi:hypothetical protein